MFLVQFLLPLADNEGRPFPAQRFARTEDELTEAFGGVTAHLSAPARGTWRSGDEVTADSVVLFEVLTGTLDRPWWAHYRTTLEARFRQDEVLIRAVPAERL